MNVILTGATGMAGEGVLLECLQNNVVTQVLMVNRSRSEIEHKKLKELLVPDFLKAEDYSASLVGYDACFYCAGVSSVGMSEEKYTKITYDTTLHFAQVVAKANPNMVFTYITGSDTDSSEKGNVMWARVKGKTENDLLKLPFKGEYNFRPAFMEPVKGQKNVKWYLKPVIWVMTTLFPKNSLTLNQLGKAMIYVAEKGYPRPILDVSDIRKAAKAKASGQTN